MVRPARFERGTFSSGGQNGEEPTTPVDSSEQINQRVPLAHLARTLGQFRQDTENLETVRALLRSEAMTADRITWGAGWRTTNPTTKVQSLRRAELSGPRRPDRAPRAPPKPGRT